jgi:hypothetical protein
MSIYVSGWPRMLLLTARDMSLSTTAERVAERHLASLRGQTAVMYRSPSGITWGWWSPSPPRMHIRPMTAAYQHLGVFVWLEDDGVRAFEAEGGELLPDGALDELRTWVAHNRAAIESRWVRFLQQKGWLRVVAHRAGVTVTAYPHRDTEIVREIDLTMCPCRITDGDVAIVDDSLIIGSGWDSTVISLPRLLWKGADDGSDAGMIPF